MYKSIITKAEKAILQEDGSLFLDVEFDILDGEEVIDTKRLAFAADTSSRAILDEVKLYTENYKAEIVAAVENAEVDEEQEKADATIEDITGTEITI